MATDHEEEELLRSVALRNAESVLRARRRAEEELIRAKEALEQKTEELARSLAMMRATLESTTDGMLVTDRHGRVTGFNQRYAEMWRIPPEKMNQGEHRQLIEECARQFADPRAFADSVDRIYATAPLDSFDVLCLRDGRVFERSSRIQFVDDRNVGRVWSFRDITERRRVEEALREETRILELLNQSGTAIASTLDLLPLLQTVTDAATQLSGARFGAFFYTATDDEGEKFQLYVLSGAEREDFERFGHPRVTSLFAPTFRGGDPIRIDDVLKDPRYGHTAPHHGMPEGHPPVRSYLAIPVVARTGESIGGLLFGHPEPGVFTDRAERVLVSVAGQAAVAIDNARLYADVRRVGEERERVLSAERAARSEAERVSLMKDEFLATLSHELRTPLNAILGWSQILNLGRRSGEDLKQGLEAIERSARAQTRLIEDLLDMSRIISGKVRLDVQRTDLAGVVNAAIDSVRPSAEAKEILLRRIVDPAAGPVSGDPNRLQQVVWNLLTNAVKFTPREGRIDIMVERVNSHLEVTVTDTGIGIDPAFLPHVFERFRQADSSMTRNFGGLGIGLSIVKQIVELHGGSVRAESPGLGQGASFIVNLPLSPVREAANREHPSTATSAPFDFGDLSLSGVMVLVVDDEPDARSLLRRVLVECHAEVVTAASAVEGLEILQRERPHVVVSDIGMPDKDGFQFIREVRLLPPSQGGRTPAIALTAFARSEDRVRAMMAGYQIHISKPIEPQELLAAVKSLAARDS